MAQLTLAGTAGRIEALLDTPPGSPIALALLCHPHPLLGGTMHTHAVYWAMHALRARSWAVLRFNFRGVGFSEGQYDAGRGEQGDASIALEALRGRWPGLPLIAGGFSFGAWVGLSAGVAANAEGLLGIGAPYSLYDFAGFERSARPKALVHAERDEIASVDAIEAAVGRMSPPVRLWVVRGGAKHLFTENLTAYRDAVGAAAEWMEGALGLESEQRPV